MDDRTIDGIEGLRGLVGKAVGTSNWLTVDQARINAFAEATGDDQWIHVDPERSRRESPYGGPVAHGLLTLSLIPVLNRDVLQVSGITAVINYGMDRVRFPAAVPSGARLRSHVKLLSLEPMGEGRFQARYETSVELEGSEKPACVAINVAVYVV